MSVRRIGAIAHVCDHCLTLAVGAIVALLLSAAAFAQSPTVTPGTLGGQLSVDQSGAASYTIPIEVPPGIAGMQPELSLQYNSRGGNGLLGVGWSLGGLSLIHRCPKTIAQDGERGGIALTANDRFCLDGERLIATDGDYGGDGTEYRTEIDGFLRVLSYGTAGTGPAHWTVQTKSGQVLEFGSTADSRIEAQGSSEVMVWAVSRVEDSVGNYLTFHYAEDTLNGSYRPIQIEYAGNSLGGVEPHAYITFEYSGRLDIVPRYFAGALVAQTQRLDAPFKTRLPRATVTT